MQALGLVETRGLLPAIECADVMLKTAQVELVERTLVGGGYVTIAVTGDVAAVQASVEAGAAAAAKLGRLPPVSRHVIPRPHPDLAGMIAVTNPGPDRSKAREVPERKVNPQKSGASAVLLPEHTGKEDVDALVRDQGITESIGTLKRLSVVKLRKLVRDYEELDLAGRAISKANKDLLIEKLTEYYRRGSNK
ncbi:MAG: BMC domain-containing protein [Peptococcaceae bacterium]